MKQALLAVLVALVLGATAACGGSGGGGDKLTKQEQKVADNIATHFSKTSAGALKKKDAQCFGDKFVASAGVKALQKANLVDKDGKVVTTSGSSPKFDKALSDKYAEAYLACVDFAAAAAKSYAASDPSVDEAKLATCLEKALPDSLMKKVIVASQSGDVNQNSDVTAANKKLLACQKSSTKKKAAQ